MNLWVYDIETFPNIFTCVLLSPDGVWYTYEISPRRNDRDALFQLLHYLGSVDAGMVGFNNVGFDWPILNVLIGNPEVTARDLYDKCQEIITTEDRFGHIIRNPMVRQIDLYLVHHFNNKARSTGLKDLEFVMGMENIQDLPFPPGTELRPEQFGTLIQYNRHDVQCTARFLEHSRKELQAREDMSARYGMDFTNDNDTGIGKKYFKTRLEEVSPGCTQSQTPRDRIALADCIFPHVNFTHPEFRRVLEYLRGQVITGTKGTFKGLHAVVDGFRYDFGTGGIHGSVDPCTVQSTRDSVIVDVDVASYYPNLAISNQVYPEHLGGTFCQVYRDVYQERTRHAKGTVENAMLKLALNGVYGDSNNQFSPFYDPQYTMTITINGQLLLCMLAEQFRHLDGLRMIQINTDGLTVLCPTRHLYDLFRYCTWWEGITGLTLEAGEYSRMWVRDVNSYLAEYPDGKLKRKGAYDHDLGWHQNHSQLVVAKCAERALVHGEDIRELVTHHEPLTDFFCRAKVRRTDILLAGDVPVQRVSRYYVARNGDILLRVSPPPEGCTVGAWKRKTGVSMAEYTAASRPSDVPGWSGDSLGNEWNAAIHTGNRSTYQERRTELVKGRRVVICNDTTEIPRENLDLEYYIAEVEKLVLPLRRSL